MPIQFEILQDLRLRFVTISSVIEDHELVETFESYWRSPQYDKSLNVVYDFRAMPTTRTSTVALQEVAQLSLEVHRDGPAVKNALVASVDVVYGLNRMYQALVDRSPNSFEVFREMADALEWVGVPEDRWADFEAKISGEVVLRQRSPVFSLSPEEPWGERRKHMQLDCWEFKSCGREPGGEREAELGSCPAATDASNYGVNRGRMSGRICWAIAGTLCGGEVQGSSAKKSRTCLACEFFERVRLDEGDHFHLVCPGPR